jgi:hypothetical protein
MNFTELVATVAKSTDLPPGVVHKVSFSVLSTLAKLIEEQENFYSPILVLRGATGQLTVNTSALPVELQLEGGRMFRPTFPAQPAREHQAVFVLGMKKCGSSLFNTIVKQLCAANGTGYLSLPDQSFQQNFHFVQLGTSPAFASLFRDGWIYGGFRQLPPFLSELGFFQRRPKLLLVRDPRDALVSEYFSVAFSHSLPPASTAADGGVREGLMRRREAALAQTVDAFALQSSRPYARQLEPLLRLKEDPLLTVYRYEDVVFDKRPWITDLAKRLNLALPQPLLESILSAVDVIPSEERPTAFVRRVVPGDHREKLAPDTIKELNSRFGDFLHAFGYT